MPEFGLYPSAVVSGLGWYLGLDQQRWALECHYDQAREDALLASIGWPADGYRLFEIAALDESSVDGWFGTLLEFERPVSQPAELGFDERRR